MQENGEFTFLIGKKEADGQMGGVRVIRGMGFYTAGPAVKEIRINDFLPVEAPEPINLPKSHGAVKILTDAVMDGSFSDALNNAIKGDSILADMHVAFTHGHKVEDSSHLDRSNEAAAVLAWYVSPNRESIHDIVTKTKISVHSALKEDSSANCGKNASVMDVLLGISDAVLQQENAEEMIFESETVGDRSVFARKPSATDLIQVGSDDECFRNIRWPLLEKHISIFSDACPMDTWKEACSIADHELLLAIEMLVSGGGFDNLDARWDTERRIQELKDEIARETRYDETHMLPVSFSILEAKDRLDMLSSICQERMKKTR